MYDVVAAQGPLAMGSRLRRLSDRLMAEVRHLYRSQAVDFEPRWFPLFALLVERARLPVGEAAQALGFSHAAVSQVAGALEEAKLVASERGDDERQRVLSLTSKGRALHARLAPLWARIHDAADEVARAEGGDLLRAVAAAERALASATLAERAAAPADPRLRIVDFRPRLRDHFRRLNQRWIEAHFTLEPLDVEVLTQPERVILAPGGDVLFAQLGHEIVGTCALKPEGGGVLELTKMAVDPAQQKRGIGRRLLTAALDRARALGAERVVLDTHHSLGAAVHLYRALGFVERRRRHPSPYARSDLHFERRLDDWPPPGAPRVRPARRGDRARVLGIARQLVDEGTSYAFEPEVSDAELLDYWLPEGAWVAEHDGAVRGMAVLRPIRRGRGSHVANMSVAVDAAARGRGVGRALGEHTLGAARRRGYQAMQLDFVVSSNEAAVRLWSDLGFDVVGRLPRAFEHRKLGRVDALIMYRPLYWQALASDAAAQLPSG